MYNDFFGFRDYPFNVTPDPKIFYTNPIYQRTYAYLLYAICERKGVVALTGEAGTGKTTLLRRLMRNLENIVQFAFCPYPISSFADLLDFVCDDLALPQKPHDQTQQLEALRSFLVARKRQKQYCALLIDEAHNLQPPVLSALVQLADFTVEGEMLLPIILAGQPELEDNLSHPLAASLKLLVTGSHRLDRLKKNEVGPFIFHRLSAADCDRHNIFPPEVVRDIAEYAQGIPRYINTICDNSLLVACAEAKNIVTREIIEEVARDLRLPAANDPGREVSIRSYRPEHSHTGTTPEMSVQQLSVFDTPAHQRGQPLLASGSGFFPRARRQLITGVGLGVGSLLLFLLSSHLPSSVATKLDLEHGLPPEFNSAKTLLPSSLPSSSPPLPPIIASQKTPPPLEQTNKPPKADFSEQATREVTIATLSSAPAVTGTEQKKTHADSHRAPSASAFPVQSEKVLPSLLPEETLAPERHLQEKSEKRTSTANQQTPLTHAPTLTSQGEKAQREAPRTTARRDEKGSTPLMLAVMHGHTATVRELLRRGADVNEQNADGRTALMLAALAGRTSMLQTLLNNGAVVNATNAEGWTALMYAAWNGHTKIVQLLVRSGADVEAKNSAGGTALAHALRNGHREAARVLLRTGATGAAAKKPSNKLAEAQTSRSRDAHSLVLLKSSERR